MIRVIALAGPKEAIALERLGLPNASLHVSRRWIEFLEAVSARTPDVALVALRESPTWNAEARREGATFAATLRTLPYPLVVLCDESLVALRLAFSLAPRPSSELAVIRADGSLDGVAEAIQSAAATLAGMRVFARLVSARPMIERSPRRRMIQHVLLHPQHFSDQGLGVRGDHLSTTVANAELRRLSVQSLRVLRRVARATTAVQLARAHGLALKQIAVRVGCGSEDTLQRDIQRVAGASLTSVLAIDDDAEIIERAVEHCLRGTEGPEAERVVRFAR
jgi:hypothetical protein